MVIYKKKKKKDLESRKRERTEMEVKALIGKATARTSETREQEGKRGFVC